MRCQQMKIGTTLHLSMQDPRNEGVLNLRCNVIEIDKDFLYIDYPINIITSKTVYIEDHTILNGVYTGKDKVPLHFPTKVVKKLKLTVPALAIELPHEEKIKRIQRRNYVRVRTVVDLAIHSQNGEFGSFTTITADISGGGVSIVLPKDSYLKTGDKVIQWIVLPMQSKQIEYIKAEGEMIREIQSNHGVNTASIRFTTITNVERQKIIRFCFEKQREARSKGLML